MISVVIPTLNPDGRLRASLDALTEGAGNGAVLEVILADGGSGAGIDRIAAEVGAVVVRSEPGRGRQLAQGCAAARAPWLLILHGDTRLPAGWTEDARRHMGADPDRAAAFRLRFDEPGLRARWVAGWANLRSVLFALPYGDQGLLISQQLYGQVGGYPAIALMEDVALARALGRRRIVLLESAATTSAERYRRDGWLRRGARNLTCLGLYFLGVSPDRLRRWYQGGGAGLTRPPD